MSEVETAAIVATTGISWTDHTFNGISGCTMSKLDGAEGEANGLAGTIAPECHHCYAMNLPPGMRRNAVWGTNTSRVEAPPAYWRSIGKWHREATEKGTTAKVFSFSVADVFERHTIPDEQEKLERVRYRLVAAILSTQGRREGDTFRGRLVWQLLTKRAGEAYRFFKERFSLRTLIREMEWYTNLDGASLKKWCHIDGWTALAEVLPADLVDRYPDLRVAPDDLLRSVPLSVWLPNAWIGASTGSRISLETQLPWLNRLDSTVRFLSCEPLVEEVRIPADANVNWIIIGGESGRGSRPMLEGWIHSLITDARTIGASVFMKQMGSVWGNEQVNRWIQDGGVSTGRPKPHAKGGEPSEWDEEIRIQEFPNV